ncbi:pyrroloquinoline quinone biosynthesis protein PqqC [Nostoc linckia z18]|uniref:Pyrroloquinoline quinone biosynthesis protein PqqC n=2 Tax=Nostoc linckia TaxID=92942 RepID=A0A9Q5Z9F1_NOSLI|nr:pyrroloquinoline quinone biosynthesis protein PqqC [Nostoc linckia z1]PHJ58770.1 pyrroloquinoline quinone biosynthesis protein PqqC [Nostoc linckia z3]PHJ62572.1 pyrroloquinoline quinone biosynthesis protein PqqC [Nostoc linckia z2]PHJ75490.1 pyrroloquinoline quinone biosynthesis protein PqqC [Nostoc linckia z4]PHJ80092.1 pyrroloquinoline quinone biosynthesis protein PqqC [Nostoc linckia z6]PHJ93562.1 pyrroloquinoline quinone biosynthesis protein PqqC [Nostoc linckia z7]PHK01036.1 pyrroloq
MKEFISLLDRMIYERRKMTSPLYQVILSGNATQRLLQGFVINRWPIKNFWSRNILGIASRIDDYSLRLALVENIYEEETGFITKSSRHLQSFVNFGEAVGLTQQEIEIAPVLSETQAVIEHNVNACNNSNVHFSAGVASVLLLMEGQPSIVNETDQSMESIMKNVYQLDKRGYDFFTHHASSNSSHSHVSDLEDDHATVARDILRKYCKTEDLQKQAIDFLAQAIELRHQHFDMILRNYYDPHEAPFRSPVNQEEKLLRV